jgi:hypothetical protein
MSLAALVLGFAAFGCSPDGDDTGGSCSSVNCSVNCASQGAGAGRCIDNRCSCDGTATGVCDETSCNMACRTYAGAVGGTCVAANRCECTGSPTDAGDTPADTTPGSYGHLHGVVMSPGAVFPISGAVVYAERAGTPIGPLPDGNYCPRCLDLTLIPNTVSGADGYFRLEHLGLGDWNLVVQKGQFRRVRQVSIREHLEEVEVPIDFTTLPNANDPEGGDTIPRIAVALGSYDRMQDILAKVALAELTYDDRANLDRANFDVYDNGGGGLGTGTRPFRDLLQDFTLLSQYQIIFIPCSSGGNDSLLTNATVRDNIRRWVSEGGKWYVADWSYEWVTFMFPDAVRMYGDDGSPGDADVTPSYNGPGRVVDEDMAAWLRAMGDTPDAMTFDEIYNNICSLGTIAATDEDGNPIDVTPKTWAQGRQLANQCGGGEYPYTVSFPFGCGRVLFTDYHTVGEMGGTHPGLLPQEKILLYLVMEIGICTDEVIIW